MKILVLQGPNLNLLGVRSARSGERLTLDKLNKALRRHVRNTAVELKILQTHKEYIALNFIQRNRNRADGILLIPMSWARYNWTLEETLSLVKLPTTIVYFDGPYGFGTSEKNSILSNVATKSITGPPMEACINALNHIIDHCSN